MQTLADDYAGFDDQAMASFIGNTGVIAVVKSKPELSGKPLADLRSDADELVALIQADEPNLAWSDGSVEVLAPIEVGKTTTPWAAVLSVPETSITADATRWLRWALSWFC